MYGAGIPNNILCQLYVYHPVQRKVRSLNMIQMIKKHSHVSQIQFWNVKHYQIYILPMCSLQGRMLFLFDSTTRYITVILNQLFFSSSVTHTSFLRVHIKQDNVLYFIK